MYACQSILHSLLTDLYVSQQRDPSADTQAVPNGTKKLCTSHEGEGDTSVSNGASAPSQTTPAE